MIGARALLRSRTAIAAGSAAGFAFGAAVVADANTVDLKAVRKDLADLYDSENAVNPSADNAPGNPRPILHRSMAIREVL